MFEFLTQQDYSRYVTDLNLQQAQAALAARTVNDPTGRGTLTNLANIQIPSPTVARIRKIGGRAFSEELGRRIAEARDRMG